MRTYTKKTQATTTPQALQYLRVGKYLRVGNYRFQNNLKAPRDLLQQVNETRDGQFPLATILSCRTGAELMSTRGIGDILSIRLAANVVSDAVAGSMELACKVAGPKLVLGHTKCGAIRALVTAFIQQSTVFGTGMMLAGGNSLLTETHQEENYDA
jgi:carbonic anhydrase